MMFKFFYNVYILTGPDVKEIYAMYIKKRVHVQGKQAKMSTKAIVIICLSTGVKKTL